MLQELVFAAAAIALVCSPQLQSFKWRVVRVNTFVALAASAVIPIGHGTYLFGLGTCLKHGLPFYVLEGVAYLVGTWFYMVSFPL